MEELNWVKVKEATDKLKSAIDKLPLTQYTGKQQGVFNAISSPKYDNLYFLISKQSEILYDVLKENRSPVPVTELGSYPLPKKIDLKFISLRYTFFSLNQLPRITEGTPDFCGAIQPPEDSYPPFGHIVILTNNEMPTLAMIGTKQKHDLFQFYSILTAKNPIISSLRNIHYFPLLYPSQWSSDYEWQESTKVYFITEEFKRETAKINAGTVVKTPSQQGNDNYLISNENGDVCEIEARFVTSQTSPHANAVIIDSPEETETQEIVAKIKEEIEEKTEEEDGEHYYAKMDDDYESTFSPPPPTLPRAVYYRPKPEFSKEHPHIGKLSKMQIENRRITKILQKTCVSKIEEFNFYDREPTEQTSTTGELEEKPEEERNEEPQEINAIRETLQLQEKHEELNDQEENKEESNGQIEEEKTEQNQEEAKEEPNKQVQEERLEHSQEEVNREQKDKVQRMQMIDESNEDEEGKPKEIHGEVAPPTKSQNYSITEPKFSTAAKTLFIPKNQKLQFTAGRPKLKIVLKPPKKQ